MNDRQPIRACRLLVDRPQDGAWNMAVDDLLLEAAAETGAASLRFYRWAEPTLSLGYFQTYDDRLAHHASRESAVVRRASGGGAILHDREVTYCLAMPGGHGLAGDSTWLYTLVHKSLVEILAKHGIAAVRCGASLPAASAEPPFLCFLRRAPGDVLVGGAKVCGSAQRRRRGAILQHGSLILNRSPAAPELPGLAELTEVSADADRLISDWSQAIGHELNLKFTPAPLEAELASRARSLALSKYQNQGWTRRR